MSAGSTYHRQTTQCMTGIPDICYLHCSLTIRMELEDAL